MHCACLVFRIFARVRSRRSCEFSAVSSKILFFLAAYQTTQLPRANSCKCVLTVEHILRTGTKYELGVYRIVVLDYSAEYE